MVTDWLIELGFDLKAVHDNNVYPLLVSVVPLNRPEPGWTTRFMLNDTMRFRLVNYTKDPESMNMDSLTVTCRSAATGLPTDIFSPNPVEFVNFETGLGSYVLPPDDAPKAPYWYIPGSSNQEATFVFAESPEPHRFLLRFEAVSGPMNFGAKCGLCHDPEIFIGPGS